MRVLQFIMFVFHGLIHLMGFSKAFSLAVFNQVNYTISKAQGIFRFVAAVLFIAAAVVFFLRMEWWWMLAVGGVFVSQYLIIVNWQTARLGTVGNAFILLAAGIGFATWNFARHYRHEVKQGLDLQIRTISENLTDAQIQRLPPLVQRYLNYTGVVGKHKTSNFKVKFCGELRQKGDVNWMPVVSQQYNFIPKPTRLFFLNATMKHFPVAGFHCFKDGKASMDIRLFSLFKVQYESGKEMDVAETVTFFNDMCVLAPSTLVDERVKWVQVEKDSVKATFTNNNITVSAWLHFNERGELINFISDDRYATLENGAMEKVRWSTPLSDYKEFNGYKLPSHAEAVYSFPDGDFCYGKFTLTDVVYNVTNSE